DEHLTLVQDGQGPGPLDRAAVLLELHQEIDGALLAERFQVSLYEMIQGPSTVAPSSTRRPGGHEPVKRGDQSAGVPEHPERSAGPQHGVLRCVLKVAPCHALLFPRFVLSPGLGISQPRYRNAVLRQRPW